MTTIHRLQIHTSQPHLTGRPWQLSNDHAWQSGPPVCPIVWPPMRTLPSWQRRHTGNSTSPHSSAPSTTGRAASGQPARSAPPRGGDTCLR